MSGRLYIVGTPIGNLDDISKRALDTLKTVDFIIAEDTRVSLKLLNRYSIKKHMVSFHEFSRKEKAAAIAEKIYNENSSAALITDAGMPCISDPGSFLVNICRKKNIDLKVVPGPSALTAAISLSGINCQRFLFFGFLPNTKKEKLDFIISFKNLQYPIVIYESPHKLINTLKLLYEHLGNRKIIIAKELTKIYELVEIFKLEEAIEQYCKKEKIKGEYVLIIDSSEKEDLKAIVSFDKAVDIAKNIVKSGEKPTVAAKKAAAAYNFKKADIYKKLLTKE